MAVALDETHDPALVSWVPGADGHADFPVQNLPLGIFSPDGGTPRPGTAIGDHILDLSDAAGLLPDAVARTLGQPTLNAVMALPARERASLRRAVSRLLTEPLHRDELTLYPAATCTMHLPATIGDYTDFYVGIHHAENVGRQFRPECPLLPNYKWVPIGYHGRASSIRVSGDPVVRPNGQRKALDDDAPLFGPSQRLDYELELGIWVGAGNTLGEPIPIGRAQDHIAGLCLLNDWSARDLQAWEYQPLGPFLAKNFHSTVSPWVVTVEALAPFRIAQPPRPDGDPAPLAYLWDESDQAHGALALELEVTLSSEIMRAGGIPPVCLSRGPASVMYWTFAQIVTHHASGGCNLRSGDLIGTGTLSGPDESQFGSLLEISRGGRKPLTLPTGETRSFLADGDEITLAAHAHAPGRVSIGLGTAQAIVLPARA